MLILYETVTNRPFLHRSDFRLPTSPVFVHRCTDRNISGSVTRSRVFTIDIHRFKSDGPAGTKRPTSLCVRYDPSLYGLSTLPTMIVGFVRYHGQFTTFRIVLFRDVRMDAFGRFAHDNSHIVPNVPGGVQWHYYRRARRR